MKPANPLRAAVEELRQVTGWLKANLTAPSATTVRLTDEQLAESAADERLAKAIDRRNELRAGVLVPLGHTGVPLNLNVMDLLLQVLDFASLWSGLPAPVTALEDPMPHLNSLRVQLRLGQLAVPDLDRFLDECEDLRDRAYRALGLVPDGQILAAVCPWCGGRTSKHPTGGARTMRVRMKLPDGKRTVTDVDDPADIHWYVVCEGGLCEPPAKDCGERLRGRPAWPLKTEGDWLAKRIASVGVA